MNQYFQKAKQKIDDAFSQSDKNGMMDPQFNEHYNSLEKMKTSFKEIRKGLRDYIRTVEENGKECKNLDKLLANTLVKESEKYSPNSLLRSILHKVGIIQSTMAMQITDYEIDLDENFRQKIIQIVEVDLEKVEKARKKLSKAKSTLDACQSKLKNSQTQSTTPQKQITLETDVESALTSFENHKDQFAIETYRFIAREKELSILLVSFIEKQKHYHQSAYDVLKGALPELNGLLDSTMYQPIFGLPIEQHEKVFGTTESFVITDCVNYIEKYGLESEGIFRVGASSNLVARLKSEFDAGVANLEGEKPSVDTVASCLKLYLRELPEPLLTYKLKEKFLSATQIEQKEREQAITNLLHQLPNPNYVNLKFLINFLTKIVSKNEKNKMTSSNISIVIGPNLLWSQDSNQQMTYINAGSCICDCLITHYQSVFDSSSGIGKETEHAHQPKTNINFLET